MIPLRADAPLSLDLLPLLSHDERVELRQLREAGADSYFASRSVPIGTAPVGAKVEDITGYVVEVVGADPITPTLSNVATRDRYGRISYDPTAPVLLR